jgi:uncharacterized metal-binding protein
VVLILENPKNIVLIVLVCCVVAFYLSFLLIVLNVLIVIVVILIIKCAVIVVGMDAPSECATIMRKRNKQREPQTTKSNTILSQ